MTDLQKYPPHDKWHDWTELDAKAWPDKVERNYTLVPTTCFNCEAACGLLAYFDNETGEIAKIEGNPEHPASRGRNFVPGMAPLPHVNEQTYELLMRDNRELPKRIKEGFLLFADLMRVSRFRPVGMSMTMLCPSCSTVGPVHRS